MKIIFLITTFFITSSALGSTPFPEQKVNSDRNFGGLAAIGDQNLKDGACHCWDDERGVTAPSKPTAANSPSNAPSGLND